MSTSPVILIRMAHPARSLGFLLFLITLPCAAYSACTRPAQQAAVTKALLIRRDLLAVPVTWGDIPFPGASAEHFEQLKRSLLEVADTTMACEPPDVTAHTIQQHLVALLHANEPREPNKVSKGDDMKKPKTGIIAANLQVHAAEALASPRLVIVDFDSGILCGDDNVLVVFQQTPKGWKDVLRWRKKHLDNNTLGEAFGDIFPYAILPGTGGDSWRLVAIHGYPWCTSSMSIFTIDLLAASPDPDMPRVVSSIHREYRRFWDDPPIKFLVEGNSFTLRADVDTGEGDIMVRKAIFHYRLEGDHLRRLAPIATNGAFFVNEWLQIPWGEAVGFIDPQSQTALQAIHARYQQKNNQPERYVTYGFGPVRQCAGSTKKFQVAVDESPEKGNPMRHFFFILENGNGYTLLSTSARADPHCNGPDLMPTH